MRFGAVTVVAALAASAAASPSYKRNTYAVKDKHTVPSKWTQLERAPKDHTISLRIGLKQDNFDELERDLYEVSDPSHKRYGQHLSASDVHKHIAPAENSLAAIHEWLEENNVRLDQLNYSPAKDWVIVRLPVSTVEELLDTEYHVYEDADGSQVVRTPHYSLPRALHEHVDVIQPTNYFGNPKALSGGKPFMTGELEFVEEGHHYYPPGYNPHKPHHGGPPDVSAVCNETAVTSLCLRTFYNTVNYVPQVPHLNSVGMTAYLNESANISDFHTFLSRQRKDANLDYTFDVEQIDGGINMQAPETTYYGKRDVEANLDAQSIGGIVYPTDIKVYSTGGSPPFKPDIQTPTDTNEPYLAWLDYMMNVPHPPHTISTSYGDDEQTVPESYARRACREFAQLGARGSTLLFSSGDSGVGANGTCITNDGKNTTQFMPSFPASCPYVTTVGATRNFSPEIVAYNVNNGYVGGSGFSNYFPRPWYQSRAVDSYLHSIGDLHSGLYNKHGRAYPDLSAQGFHFVVVYAGRDILVDGTSASSPAAAGILTLVNDALIADGKRPLGFMNPALYSGLNRGFNDVTGGNTWGCDTSGFPAGKGWDAATGWGTPDFLKVKDIALRTGGWGGYGGYGSKPGHY